MGLDDPCFSETDEELLEALVGDGRAGVTLDELRARGFAKVDLGQGETPHAEGGFSFPDGRLALDAAATTRRRGGRRRRWPSASRWR